MVRLRAKQEPTFLRRLSQGGRTVHAVEVHGDRERDRVLLWVQEHRQRTALRRDAQEAEVAAELDDARVGVEPPVCHGLAAVGLKLQAIDRCRACAKAAWCGLTFELRGGRRQAGLAARRMIDSKSLAAKLACRWPSAPAKG